MNPRRLLRLHLRVNRPQKIKWATYVNPINDMSRPVYEAFQANEALGLHTDFALTTDNFVQAYDVQAPTMFPDLFYLPPPQPQPKPREAAPKAWKQKVEEDPVMRVWLGGMTVVGLFILYRCLLRDL
jgi:hypothetical protein